MRLHNAFILSLIIMAICFGAGQLAMPIEMRGGVYKALDQGHVTIMSYIESKIKAMQGRVNIQSTRLSAYKDRVEELEARIKAIELRLRNGI